ncbi:HsdR family type I site-specific deoxyribonuclease [Pedobacter sp. CG_S7]|uniref:type I restriction endonuclease n=1 Tax=Pedobacter sp. CG_S7 TaxID=3143930 RepID=UPI0033911AFD
MNQGDQINRNNHSRITTLFTENLGYTYLGNWEELAGNSNIEERHLSHYLSTQGYNAVQVSKVIYELKQAVNSFSDDLYQKNKKVFSLLRNGVQINEGAGTQNTVVRLIDWKNTDNNDFGIAEEVNIKGNKFKRPDLVFYVNGIALGLLELKKSHVDISEGIQQSIIAQQGYFNESFFSTIQFVMAGNDTQGLRYGTIKTEEKLYLNWNEEIAEGTALELDQYLIKICNKERFLSLIYEGVVFDSGKKKLLSASQYFTLKAAQGRIQQKEGGIIWYTPGAGKTSLMVLLSKWILENYSNARVIILTDSADLDKQIEALFNENGETIKRANNGKKLLQQLSQPASRLLCALVHKFGKKSEDNVEEFIKELEANPVDTSVELFVFVDDCHHAQSSKLYLTMKMLLQQAIFIGFTGSVLLKKDKKITEEVFGSYINSNKLNEIKYAEVE